MGNGVRRRDSWLGARRRRHGPPPPEFPHCQQRNGQSLEDSKLRADMAPHSLPFATSTPGRGFASVAMSKVPERHQVCSQSERIRSFGLIELMYCRKARRAHYWSCVAACL
jgi:hypothetical protein